MGELRQRGRVWWIRYYRNGQRHEESSGSTRKGVALDLLKIREGAVAAGVPVSAKISRFRFDEAATDLITEYKVNERRSLDELERRIEKHLKPYFTGRRMASISTADVRSYVAHRQEQGIVAHRGPRTGERIADVSNAEINRELTILKRMFSLAVQAEKILRRPHIPLLEERNTRTGFFEPEQYQAVLRHLPAPLRPVLTFAYVTGWRIASEVLPLEWRQVDFTAGEIRLDAETTKNRDGRVFPMTDDLRVLLTTLRAEYDQRRKGGQLAPWVFVRMVANGRRGAKAPKRIAAFTKAWKHACRAAGCPGRIPHDLRRTAVRNMIRRGVPERVAMQLAGHKTRSVFDRYNIVSDGDLRTAAGQLSGVAGTIQGQAGSASPASEGETIKIAQ
jgi:integrase